ncbi:hypothetical protein GCM10027590_68650 [Nocardiopsis nanhaiensis]
MRTLRAVQIIGRRVFARPVPPTAALLANRARADRKRKVAADYEAAIAQELAARGKAAHLYRTQGSSSAAHTAAQEHTRATRYRAQLGDTLFRLHAHRTVPAN